MCWAHVQGGDRWQPPDLPNTGEVLIRPEPIEQLLVEEAVPHPEQAPKDSSDVQAASLPATAAVAAPADVSNRLEQSQEAEEEKDQRQHRHRSVHSQQQIHVILILMLQQWLQLAPSVFIASAYVKALLESTYCLAAMHDLETYHCCNETPTHLLSSEAAKSGWACQLGLFMP